MKKPIVGFIAGVTAPAGQAHGPRRRADLRQCRHGRHKLAIMEECGFKVTRNPSEMGKLLKAMLCKPSPGHGLRGRRMVAPH